MKSCIKAAACIRRRRTIEMIYLLQLPLLLLLFWTAVHGKETNGDLVELLPSLPAEEKVPPLVKDNSSIPAEALNHFGIRTKWEKCKDLYSKLAVGDLIELVGVPPVLKNFSFQHWGLYSGQLNGIHYIINYHLAPLGDMGTMKEEPLDDEFHNRVCRINNRQDWIDAPHRPWMTVERARAMIIKRGKNYREAHRPKRFQYDWAEDLWQKFIEAKNKKVDEVQAFAAYVASALADSYISQFYDDLCEILAADIAKYKVLLEEEEKEPMEAPPKDDEAHSKVFRGETEILDPYYCERHWASG